MIDYSLFKKIYLTTDTNLFRGGIPSFQIKVRAFFPESEINDNLFVFISRTFKQIKLYYENNQGTWLAAYKLRKGRFNLDFNKSGDYELTKDEIKWIINGLKLNEFEKFK